MRGHDDNVRDDVDDGSYATANVDDGNKNDACHLRGGGEEADWVDARSSSWYQGSRSVTCERGYHHSGAYGCDSSGAEDRRS